MEKVALSELVLSEAEGVTFFWLGLLHAAKYKRNPSKLLTKQKSDDSSYKVQPMMAPYYVVDRKTKLNK